MKRTMRVSIWLVSVIGLVLPAGVTAVPDPSVTGPIPANAEPGDPSHDPSGELTSLRAACTSLLPLIGAPAQGQRWPDSAFERWIARTPGEFEAALHECRPRPVSDNAKALILASLPKQGRVTHFNAATRQKLASLPQVLRVHGRESQYAVIVIDIPQAAIVLHARTVLLISKAALSLLRAEELEAITAHEIGHEYIWEQYRNADAREDWRTQRDLELWCDAVAVLTLRHAGVNPSHLVRGLRKLRLFNFTRFGRALNEDSYPRLEEREKDLRGLIAWAMK